MKILIASDSHGDIGILREIIADEKPEQLFFLGDFIKDVNGLEKKIKVSKVKGNLDYKSRGQYERMVSIGKLNILLTHGHQYRVKYTPYKLYLRARELGANLVFFGHTHQYSDYKEEGIHFINPGSISKPRGQEFKSYVILNTSTEGYEVLLKKIK